VILTPDESAAALTTAALETVLVALAVTTAAANKKIESETVHTILRISALPVWHMVSHFQCLSAPGISRIADAFANRVSRPVDS
jgi:hypothetical protein